MVDANLAQNAGSGSNAEPEFIFDVSEGEIRAVVDAHPDGLDADLVVDLYRAPFECWKFFDLCWDVSEQGALEVLRGEWDLLRAGVADDDLHAAVVALIDAADDTHPPGIHLTAGEEQQFASYQAPFVPINESKEGYEASDNGAEIPASSVAGENVGDGSGSFAFTSASRDWCFDGGGFDDVTSPGGTFNVKASSPYVVIGTQARVKATSTYARDLEIDGEYVIMTIDPNSETLPYVRTEHQYAQDFEADALSIVLNSSEVGANYKGSGGCATAGSSSEYCACRNPMGFVRP